MIGVFHHVMENWCNSTRIAQEIWKSLKNLLLRRPKQRLKLFHAMEMWLTKLQFYRDCQKRCVLDWTLGYEISAWNSLSNKHFPLVSTISIAFMYFQKTIRHLVFPICNHCQYKYFFCWCKRLPLGYADISLRIISVRLSVDILLFINENANEMGR